ncbi:ABC transporter ATP-binding protein [Actinomyces sp.]|uniref:ABC transporter ATP-binding protein n=1 Tax=Actinomyces sp. TaxID=29317 RepID=UPI0026DD938E|nr:ABC transporter ATP-binding protein [Actinomyces sp.]MDO4900623.1 ABC transporter ATP-binding protein [Actinomyces sp.]
MPSVTNKQSAPSGTEPTMAVDVRNVGKAYGKHRVLDGVSFTVGSGEMFAVTGPSGSGKSTLLNILGLLEAPSNGHVLLKGSPSPRPRTRAANLFIRYQLGYLFQNYALIDHRSVESNLRVALTYVDTSGRAKSELISEALAAVGLSGFESRKVYTISGGEQQRVAIARLMLKPCDIVLADEPTGSLDNANRDAVLELLQELRLKGKTIVVASHDDAVIEACSNTIDLQP